MNNYENLRELFVNDQCAFGFAMDNGLIPRSYICKNCNNHTTLMHDSDQKYGFRRICTNCHCSYSILTGTIFTRAKLPICKVLQLIYYWALQYSCKHTAFECGVNINTVTNYFACFRDCCHDEVMNSAIQPIGGPGEIVEIDESALTTRKYNRGRLPPQQIWIFGGICRRTRKRFCFVVPMRDTLTLKQYIDLFIKPGTTIISDCWKAYNYLDKAPFPAPYLHQTVNHSYNFVDPITGAHTQTVERMWREVKRIKRMYEGIPSKYAEEHIAEYVWRSENIISINDSFSSAIRLIRNIDFK